MTLAELETLARKTRRAARGDVDISLPLLAEQLAEECIDLVTTLALGILDNGTHREPTVTP
jgi:hypothetical protein